MTKFAAIVCVFVALLTFILWRRRTSRNNPLGARTFRREVNERLAKAGLQPIILSALCFALFALLIYAVANGHGVFSQVSGDSTPALDPQTVANPPKGRSLVPGVVLMGIYVLLVLNGLRMALRHWQRVQRGECDRPEREKFARDIRLYFQRVNFGVIGFVLIVFVLSLLFYKR